MSDVMAVTYVAMVTAVANDDVKALKHLLQTGADVNANLDDDIGIDCDVYRVAQKTGPAYLIANIIKTP